MAEAGKYVAAICAAPMVLAKAGVLTGKSATGYPGVLEEMKLENVTLKDLGKAKRVLYVGKAVDLRSRVRSYFTGGGPEDRPRIVRLLEDVRDLETIRTKSEQEALLLETSLITKHRPPGNVRLRDDKNHPYLRLTLREDYPRLYVERRPSEDGDAYGGPYIPASLGRKTAGLVRKVFGIRSCKETLNGRRPRP